MITSDMVCIIEVREVKTLTFQEWCDENNVPPELRAEPKMEVAVMDLAFGPNTASAKGKSRGRLQIELNRAEVRARYDAEVPSKWVTEEVEPNPFDAKYCARMLVLNRREARRAEALEVSR